MSSPALRGGAVTLLGQWLKLLAQLVGLAALSRLVDPVDFGKFAMIIALSGVALIFSDFGLSLAAVQARDLDNEESSNLFWLNVALGAVIALGFFFSAPLIASYYREPSLIEAVRLLATVFVLNGIAVQPRALINRGLRFSLLAFLEAGGQIAGVSVAIVMAVFGAGLYSLVAQQIVNSSFILVLSISLCQWRPGLPSKSTSIRRFVRFGFSTFATQSLNYGSSNVDFFVLGRFWGAFELGIYSRAFQVCALPLQQLAAPLTRVVVPLLSRIESQAAFNRTVYRSQSVFSYSMIWLLGILAAAAAPLVEVALGPNWKDAPLYIQILTIGGVFQVLGYVYYWAFLARSQMRTLLYCEGCGRVLMLVLIVLAGPLGPYWVASAYSLGLFIVWGLTSLFGVSKIGLSVVRMTTIALRPLVQTMIFVGASIILRNYLNVGSLSPVLQILSLTLLAIAVALASIVIPKIKEDYKILGRSGYQLVASIRSN